MNQEIFGITFNAFYLFIPLIILLIVIFVLGLKRYFAQKKIALLLSPLQQIKHRLRNFSLTKKKLKLLLFVLATIFLCIALLRPAWSQKTELVTQCGRDIFIAMDISRSMLAQDLKPNRLEFAKQKIKELTKKLVCERIGLIIFAGDAFLLCPLTSDLSAFYLFLDSINDSTLSSSTTYLDKPISKAISIFNQMASKKNKLLVILTDGEDFSTDLDSIKKKAQEIGLHVFCLGIGTQAGAPIPLLNEKGEVQGYQKDENGNVVISKLNEALLKTLATETNGKYITTTMDNSDINKLVYDVKKYEKEKYENENITTLQEQYSYFALASFILFLLEWIL